MPNGYDRAVVRTWSAVLPIAAARQTSGCSTRAGLARERFREPESPSPYALVMGAARRLELVNRGLGEPFVPDVEERLPSFGLRYSTPSWLAGLETVLDSWLAAGELEGAGRALDRRAGRAPARDARPIRVLVAARRNCWRRAATIGRRSARALAGFRESRAPWWIAKALRVLGEKKDAEEIERALGIPIVSA